MSRPMPSLLFEDPAAVEAVNTGALFDERWGTILQMGFDPLPPWEPQIDLVTARLSRELLLNGSDTLRQRFVSGHTLLDRQQAMDSAVGEAIERASGGFSEWAGRGQHIADLPIIETHRMPQFSRLELDHLDSRYGHFDPESLPACDTATKLATGERYRVPAQIVFCPYHPGHGEKLFWEPTTTGLAAGRSTTRAQIGGLLEIAERDALAVSWLLRIPGQELSLDEALGEECHAIKHALLRGSAKVRLALVTLDIPLPICVAAIYDESSTPGVSFGAAAAIDLRSAAKKAMCEAALARYTLKLRISIFEDAIFNPETCDPTNYQEHGLAWARPESASQTAWIFGNRSIQLASPKVADAPPGKFLDYLMGVTGDLGYNIYDCDITRPEMIAAGWTAHRMLVPGLQPLNPGRYRRMLQSERLTRITEWLGSKTGQLEINDLVHPFC